jgi:hypothetical protein
MVGMAVDRDLERVSQTLGRTLPRGVARCYGFMGVGRVGWPSFPLHEATDRTAGKITKLFKFRINRRIPERVRLWDFDTVYDEVRNAVRQGVVLAGTGAGNHQQRKRTSTNVAY